VAMDDLYGGTHRLFSQVKARSQGLDFACVDLSDPSTLAEAVDENTKLIWVETPTNPMLKIADLAAIAEFGRANGIMTACDNTFCSPMVQRPLELGFDICMHSGTKFIGGHSDVIGGFLVTGDAALAERIRFHQNSIGSILSPFDSYLMLRGMKTLSIRMQRHCDSAMHLAKWLEEHPRVRRVIYPGLPSHPQYDLARRQMTIEGTPAGGGIISVDLDGDLAGTRKMMESLSVFTLAESLGGVESLANHPAIMTHASVPDALRAELGITDTLVRLSVGIEDVADLQDDLEQSLDAMG